MFDCQKVCGGIGWCLRRSNGGGVKLFILGAERIRCYFVLAEVTITLNTLRLIARAFERRAILRLERLK